MALSPAFVIAQNPVSPSVIIAADTSTGSDVAIVSRRITIQDYQGNYLVPAGTTTTYTVWPYANTSISLNVLTQDTAVNVKVDWLDGSGNVLYTLSQNFCLSLFNKQFAYQLIQGLTPPITLNNGYSGNLSKLWVSIIGAINAVQYANDIAASQACLNQGTYLRNNQNLFF